jgi:hypothetical protein
MKDPIDPVAPTRGDDGEGREPRRSRRLVIAILCGASILAGLGFGVKIHEFLQDWLDDQGINFGGSHLLCYALVATGYAALLTFAYLSGHFADVERPKYELLKTEDGLDRAEFG